MYFLKGLPPTVYQKKQVQIFDSSELSKVEPEIDVLIMDTADFIPYF